MFKCYTESITYTNSKNVSHFNLRKLLDNVAAVFIEFFHKAASHTLDLWVCMTDCLNFLPAQYVLKWKHEMFWESAWKRQIRLPTCILEDNITIDLRKVWCDNMVKDL